MSYVEDAVREFESLTDQELVYFFPARTRRADMAHFVERIREGRVDPPAVIRNAEVARERWEVYKASRDLCDRRLPMPVLPKTQRIRPTLRAVVS